MTSTNGTKLIHVDAVVENDGLTSIAVVLNGREARPVVARLIKTTGSVEGEMRAMLLAMEVAEKARWEKATFHCDALGVVRMIQGIAECRPDNMQALRDRAQNYMADHSGWKVEWVKRTHNSCAHAMAGQIMRAYKHGREHGRQGIGPDFEKRSKWQEDPRETA